jgi:hypothetical protein
MKFEKTLKIVTLNDIDIISKYLRLYPSENCDFNICNLICWGMYYKLEYAIVMDRLVLFNPYYSYLLFPIGEYFTAKELMELNQCCKEIHNNVEIMVVPEDYIDKTIGLDEYFEIINDEDWNDYVYLTDKLINLSGKKLAKKKNLISQFKREYPDYHIKSIDESDFKEILDFSYKWKEIQNREDDYLDIEFIAIENIIKNWRYLPAEGIKIYVNNKIVSYAIFSPQTEDMYTVHFEKFNPMIKGSAQLVNQETALYLKDKAKYINREQDIGDLGIRQAKRSYQPEKMVKYYRLKLKK